MREWNREHRRQPAWQLGDQRAFRRAFLRAEAAFLPRHVVDVFADELAEITRAKQAESPQRRAPRGRGEPRARVVS